MEFDLTPLFEVVLNQVLPVVLTALFAVIGVYIENLRKEVKVRTTTKQYLALQNYLDILVGGIEASGLQDELLAVGANKKQAVLSLAKQYVDANKIPIDVEALDVMIESIVFNEFNRWRDEEVTDESV